MRVFAFFLLLSLTAWADTSCSVSHYTASNPAQAMLDHGRAKDAIPEFQTLLAKAPNDPVLTAGLVWADIKVSDLDGARAALEPALSAHPADARLLVAKGNLDFRIGHISDADKDYAAAAHADPCLALAYWGQARIATVSSMRATAMRKLKTAHALEPDQPNIRAAWLRMQPLAERIAAAKKALDEAKDLTDQEKDAREKQISNMETALEAQQHTCEAEPITHATEIPLAPILFDPAHLNTWGLEAKVNGHTSRLVLDSGASGFYVGRAQAQAMGLKPVIKTGAYGFGDKGPQSGYLAYADTITVGPLKFHNCRVEVSDRRSVVNSDGLIGTNVFAQYMIKLDYPGKKLRLEDLPGASAPAATTGTAEEEGEEDSYGPSVAWNDRYTGPELKGFSPFYRVWSKVLVPTLVNEKGPFLFVLDTGDSFVHLDPYTAQVADIKYSTAVLEEYDVVGISGRSHNYIGGTVDLRFAGGHAKTEDITITSIHNFSSDMGVQVGGFLGAPVLRLCTIWLDYRDGMLKLEYDPRKDHRDHRLDGYDNACATQGQCEKW